MITEVLVCSLLGLLIGIYISFKSRFKFWKSLNVPYLEPTFPSGNIAEVFKGEVHFADVIEKVYRSMKHSGDYCGIYMFCKPILLALTPEFAKSVLVRDFIHFTDRGVYSNEKSDPLGANLFFLEGQRWKDLRAKLTPTFTSGKLKQMFGTLFSIGNRFVDHLKKVSDESNKVEIYELLGRFNTDVISSVAFGFESNSLENPQSEFRTMGKRMLHFGTFKSLRILFAMLFRKLALFLNMRFNDKDVADFFMNVVRETIEIREKTGSERKDFMQLLINLMKKNESDHDKLTFNEIAAQAYVFYFAGFETSATVSCFTMHSLAFEQEIQEKARQSINDALKKYNNEWCYDAIMEMTYLEQVIEESMRLNPPVGTLHRTVTKDYTLSNGAVLPEGTQIIIPNLAFHRDPETFPNPMNFDPDRFSPEAKKARHQFSWLPFGEGPRYCIGMRFGYLQTKLTLALLLHHFKLTPCDETDNPIKIHPVTLVHGPAGDVWLNIKKIMD